MGALLGKKTLWSCVPSPDRKIWRESAPHAHGRNVTTDWLRGFSFVFLGTAWARSFLRLPEAEPNDPLLLLSPWSSLGPVLLHAQLPPDPVGPAPVPRRVCRACSSAASQHRQGWAVPC